MLVSLLCFLLLPSQLLAVKCKKCGLTCSQAAPTVNPDAQSNESLRNLEFAINVFAFAARSISDSDNFVISPDSLFQTVSLLLIHAGPDGAAEQLRQIYGEGEHAEPTDAAASGTTACGQCQHPVANGMLAANPLDPVMIYRDRLMQTDDDTSGNVNFINRGPLPTLAQQLNSLFCQLTNGMVQHYCNPNNWPTSTSIQFLISNYFIGLREKSLRTESAALFMLPPDQAVALNRIIDGEVQPSQHAQHSSWEAFSFPFRNNHEMILILPPEGLSLYLVGVEIIMALISSLDSEESFSYPSTITPGLLPLNIDTNLPPLNIDTNTDLSETLSRPGSGLLSVVTSDLSSGAMPAAPTLMNVISEQIASSAPLRLTGSKRTHEEDIIPSIRFDRPLIYILRDKITRRIKFIGRYYMPRT
ncbi:serpin family protein [Endozoicomonas sp. 4G]|uniref:serpin family protein n=1 Tax=Endozoicomonas sp. 4G TaxID=2872754 RepID=UPI0020790C0F|nr:serpin family protein [Endozoicomonas sp. 4G]